MILLFISIVFFVLRLCGVIDWAYWVISLPVLLEGAFATWLFIKAEFEYIKKFNIKDIGDIKI